jgi:hypothetical protein
MRSARRFAFYAVSTNPMICSISSLVEHLKKSSPRRLASSASAASSRFTSSLLMIGLFNPFIFDSIASELSPLGWRVCKSCSIAFAALVPSLRRTGYRLVTD